MPSRYRASQRRFGNALLSGPESDGRRLRARSQSNDRMYSVRQSDFDSIDLDPNLSGIGG